MSTDFVLNGRWISSDDKFGLPPDVRARLSRCPTCGSESCAVYIDEELVGSRCRIQCNECGVRLDAYIESTGDFEALVNEWHAMYLAPRCHACDGVGRYTDFASGRATVCSDCDGSGKLKTRGPSRSEVAMMFDEIAERDFG